MTLIAGPDDGLLVDDLGRRLTTEEAAARLGRSVERVRQLVRAGRLRVHRRLGRTYFDPDEIERMRHELATVRRPLRLYPYNGKRLSLLELARMKGLRYQTLVHRLRRGWKLSRALETPCLATR